MGLPGGPVPRTFTQLYSEISDRSSAAATAPATPAEQPIMQWGEWRDFCDHRTAMQVCGLGMHGVLASLWLSACFLVCCVCAGTVDAAIGQTVTFLELHGATIHHRVIYRQEGLRGDGQPFSNQNTIDTRPRSTTLIETDEETSYGFLT